MSARRRGRLAVLGVLACGLGGAGEARAQAAVPCTAVTALPFTVAAPGRYCLQQDLATPADAAAAAAITIAADAVVLDLGGFTLASGARGGRAAPAGIAASNRRAITVRNGTLRGFRRGLSLSGTGGAHLVEGVNADASSAGGIAVEGGASIVRGCRVSRTTGTAAAAGGDAYGIRASGPGVRVLDNDVTDTLGAGEGVGRAIAVEQADGAVIEGNRIGNAASAGTGIAVLSGVDVLVVGNTIAGAARGVEFLGGGKYRDNVTTGVAVPYTGGLDAGNNR